MPSSSEKQRNYILYLRGKYKNKSNTPEKDKWIWGEEWLTVKKENQLKRYKPLLEFKQVGILYHFTSIKNLLSIIKTNQLQGAINGISTTRDKYGYKHIRGLAGNQINILLDGDKLSNNYKIYPHQDLTDKYTDEQEETIATRLVTNIKKYIIKIQLLYPNNWEFDEKEVYVFNRLMNKNIDDDFNLNILEQYLKKQNINIEIIK